MAGERGRLWVVTAAVLIDVFVLCSPAKVRDLSRLLAGASRVGSVFKIAVIRHNNRRATATIAFLARTPQLQSFINPTPT